MTDHSKLDNCLFPESGILLRMIRAYWSKRRVVPPVLFRTNYMYYSIEIPHGVTAISLTYHPHHAKLQVLPVCLWMTDFSCVDNSTTCIQFRCIFTMCIHVHTMYMYLPFSKQYTHWYTCTCTFIIQYQVWMVLNDQSMGGLRLCRVYGYMCTCHYPVPFFGAHYLLTTFENFDWATQMEVSDILLTFFCVGNGDAIHVDRF